MRRKISRVLSVFIAAALFGVLVKISLDPSETAAGVGTGVRPTYHGLHIALPDGIKRIPTGLLPQP
jgi:hypothetical protein